MIHVSRIRASFRMDHLKDRQRFHCIPNVDGRYGSVQWNVKGFPLIDFKLDLGADFFQSLPFPAFQQRFARFQMSPDSRVKIFRSSGRRDVFRAKKKIYSSSSFRKARPTPSSACFGTKFAIWLISVLPSRTDVYGLFARQWVSARSNNSFVCFNKTSICFSV